MITVCCLLLMSWVMKTITDMSEASLSIQLIIPLLKYVLYAVFIWFSLKNLFYDESQNFSKKKKNHSNLTLIVS